MKAENNIIKAPEIMVNTVLYVEFIIVFNVWYMASRAVESDKL